MFLAGSEVEQDNNDVRTRAKKFPEVTQRTHDVGNAR